MMSLYLSLIHILNRFFVFLQIFNLYNILIDSQLIKDFCVHFYYGFSVVDVYKRQFIYIGGACIISALLLCAIVSTLASFMWGGITLVIVMFGGLGLSLIHILHYFVLIIVRQMKKFHMMNITNYRKKNKKNTCLLYTSRCV